MLACVFLPATATQLTAAQSQGNVPGQITFDTVWTRAGSPYVLSGPTFVEVGVTLTIEAGAVVNLNSHIIQVNGILRARGSSVSPIYFNGGGKIVFTSTSKGWNEQRATGSIIEYAVFTQSKIEIVDASPKISNNIFKRGSIAVAGSNPHISGGSPIISGNSIVGTTSLGSGVSIAGNNYARVTGNLISGWANGVATGNAFYATASFPLVEGNLITNNTCAVKIDLLVKDWVGNNFPRIQNNTISGNGAGICIVCNWQAAGNPDEFQVPMAIMNNNIYGNGGSNLNGACVVDASFNWWGTADTAEIGQTVSANYKFAPFSTTPNRFAPGLDFNPEPALASASATAPPQTESPPAPVTTAEPTAPIEPSPSWVPLGSPAQTLIIPQQSEEQAVQQGSFPTATVAAVAVVALVAVFAVFMLRRLYGTRR